MSFLVLSGNRRQGLLSPVIKGVAAGIGLASESIHYHNEKKNVKKGDTLTTETPNHVPTTPPTEYKDRESDPSIDAKTAEEAIRELEKNEEEQWALDEAQDELIGGEQKLEKKRSETDPKKIAKRFTDTYPLREDTILEKLSLPVILPQRRPKN